MNHRLIVKPEAEADIADAFAWYENQSQGLGHRFISAVDAAIDSVQQSPLHYPCVHRTARRANIKKFPYAIYFFIEDDTIFVFAVIHGRRHPSRWQSRLP